MTTERDKLTACAKFHDDTANALMRQAERLAGPGRDETIGLLREKANQHKHWALAVGQAHERCGLQEEAAIKLRAATMDAMAKLAEDATDTVWLSKTETVFERLTHIYLMAGGVYEDLEGLWPEYFSGSKPKTEEKTGEK